MRRSPSSPFPNPRNDWGTIKTLLSYLWAYKWRVGIAMLCLIAAKASNVAVPIVLKKLIDDLTPLPNGQNVVALLPIGILLVYGSLRLSTSLFNELREYVFARVTQSALRTIALQVFRHLHSLSLRFHLNRQTGGVTRDVERGTRAVSSLISFALFSILPTLIEIAMVLGYLVLHYDIWFSAITFTALVLYIIFTIMVTEWRTRFRRTMNELDSQANSKAIDSIINYETVKYFGNEEMEAARYDSGLQNFERAAVKAQTSLSLLNVGQSSIIAVAVSLILWRATVGVLAGQMTLGDLVLVNSFMLQLYVPLNFLGVLYREIKQSLADMEKLFLLLNEHREVADLHTAKALLLPSHSGPEIRFNQVEFSYETTEKSKREILRKVSFVLPAGKTTAVVGASGSGKSTLARLLFRFYDIQHGSITIAGQEIREVTQASLRAAIGIVPQDTVLFNDSIAYNIGYGKPDATQEEIVAAAKAAYIHDFVQRLPEGYATTVGERGLKLSGGEKQRVAIARTILKNPAILILDEATSALDSKAEQAIQAQLHEIEKGRTSLVIAHRLSTIVDAAQILVMEHGRLVESGTHANLLEKGGLYAQMWARQQTQPELDLWGEPSAV